MVASVPEFTMRTISTEGTSSQTRSAMAVSASVGAPKESPRAAVSCTARITSGWAWPSTMGPQEPT